eukprot:TRINITY_DN3122_c0_g1_i3.p1 TRINITY_DN3122_c0_g1~~TRINITY_DN3122_c0_g1_i3.p1  ORF type:complete len:178 (-),score=38.38 TRINITY_DN3122_c0_g1_i3:282-815(-)
MLELARVCDHQGTASALRVDGAAQLLRASRLLGEQEAHTGSLEGCELLLAGFGLLLDCACEALEMEIKAVMDEVESGWAAVEVLESGIWASVLVLKRFQIRCKQPVCPTRAQISRIGDVLCASRAHVDRPRELPSGVKGTGIEAHWESWSNQDLNGAGLTTLLMLPELQTRKRGRRS